MRPGTAYENDSRGLELTLTMDSPVFGFLAFSGGSLSGAIIRDMKLANALRRRGYKVVVYWMFNRNQELLDAGIRQRMLCVRMPYSHEVLTHTEDMDRFMETFCVSVCNGGESDPELVGRLVEYMQKDEVTHLLPTFAMTCPIALAAKTREIHDFDYLVTFQGEEVFANYAQRAGRLEDYYRRLREVVAGSAWPAVAVSRDYAQRLRDEMGIDERRLHVIYPGIELPQTSSVPFCELQSTFPKLVRDLPIVTYIGRQDSEKGIDLLLYAAKMLEQRGVKLQLVICGSTCFGERYQEVLRQIGEHLRLEIHQSGRVSDQIRDTLYAHSRCIVYPSIHREPFGLVAAEAMSHGIPVLVPDQGGITEVVQSEGRSGGLTFQAWDSGDLACQLERLLSDDALYHDLAMNTRRLASNFTVGRMTDNVLRHMGVSHSPDSRSIAS